MEIQENIISKKSPKVFIIILNWNGKDDTLESLESVYRINCANFKVVMVDNGSTDGSVEVMRNRYQDLQIIENNKGGIRGRVFTLDSLILP